MAWAYADAAGVIGFVDRLENAPVGVCAFLEGSPLAALVDRVSVKSRHAKRDDTILVPGIPEADDQQEALRNFRRWGEWAFPGEFQMDFIEPAEA